MHKIRMDQEEIDRLAVFVQKHINKESDPLIQETVKIVYNRLPYNLNCIMEKKTDREAGK